MDRSVMFTALRDITQEVNKERQEYKESQAIVGNLNGHDNYFVGYGQLYNKECRRLNRELGLHKINK